MEGVSGQAQELSTLVLQAAARLGLQQRSSSAGELLGAIEAKLAQMTQSGPEESMAAAPIVSREGLDDSQVCRPAHGFGLLCSIV